MERQGEKPSPRSSIVRALTWQGRESVAVETVPDPQIVDTTDAIIRVTSTAICGSDLHLYSRLGMFLDAGDVLGHEAMGIVEEVGSGVTNLSLGDRVVVPFNVSCGHCWMCTRGLQSQCETTQVREQGSGAALFGYTKLYGQVPGGQAEYLRVPHADYGPVVVPQDGSPDERYLYLSDVLPTAWQGVEYADVPAGGTLLVVGLGPIGQMAARIGRHRGAAQVIGVDLVPERLEMARRHGITVIDASQVDDVAGAVRDLTQGRGADSVVEAVGMEAHGSPGATTAQKLAGLVPDPIGRKLTETIGTDPTAALVTCFESVRRGGTVSISGVYGGAATPFDIMTMFDKQVTIRMGQANVRRWTDTLRDIAGDPADPLGTLDLRTHRVSLEDAPAMYETFQKKEDGCIKVVLDPALLAG
jgi:threonine dehydrogenase-like Zn-dependent dehydrogenase